MVEIKKVKTSMVRTYSDLSIKIVNYRMENEIYIKYDPNYATSAISRSLKRIVDEILI